MSTSWRHRTRYDKRKKLFRGKDITGSKLPINERMLMCLDIIDREESRSNFAARTDWFDNHRQIKPLGNIDRYDLRKQGLAMHITYSGERCIQLMPKAKTILKQARELKLLKE